MPDREICREIRRQGGYAFAAHPNWGLTGPRTPFWELGLELGGYEASVHAFTISIPHAEEELETICAKAAFGEGREALGGAVLHVIPF